MMFMPLHDDTEPAGNLSFLPYDPGPLPTQVSPKPGESLSIALSGLPPYKEIGRSLRNATHPRYAAFAALRQAAIEAMRGRAWYLGPVKLDLTVYGPSLPKNRELIDFVGGVMDTLDGSHGPTFTYLPIIYEDDCQVAAGRHEFIDSSTARYEISITFLRDRESRSHPP
jgi:hypothetical protein